MRSSALLRLACLGAISVLTVSIAIAGCGGDEETADGATTVGGAGPTAGPTTGSTTTTGPGSTGTGGAGGTGGNATGGGGGTGGVNPGGLDCSAPSGAIPALKLTEVAGSLADPLLVKAAGSDDTRLYVIEQNGVIKILKGDQVVPTPFLDISDIVLGGGEQGLLGLAFHPDYANNGRFFVYYSASNADMTVAEYKRSADPDVAEPNAVSNVILLPDPQGNHNGGSIEFSPKDGFLYIFWGDGGGAGDQHGPIGNGQNLGTWFGKVLRLDVTTVPYTIPAGNMTQSGALPEIWDYGMRNPYRASFDGCTGDLYIGDVGQGEWEEIDVEPAGVGLNNYGWRDVEGMVCYGGAQCDPGNGNVLPMTVYDHGQGNAIIGGYVYRGSAIPGLRGTYFYGDHGSGRIWSFAWANGTISGEAELTQDLDSGGLGVSGFGQDAKGEVYVVDREGGSIFRIDAE